MSGYGRAAPDLPQSSVGYRQAASSPSPHGPVGAAAGQERSLAAAYRGVLPHLMDGLSGVRESRQWRTIGQSTTSPHQ
jgi:hypothetical protein